MAESPEVSLKSIFEKALKNFEEIQAHKVPTELRQVLISKTIGLLEESTKLINLGEVFSSNELLEEVATENVQYLAIPCMLGLLVSQLESGNRLSNLEVSLIYYKDFLTRVKEYNIVPESAKRTTNISPNNQNLTRIVMDRKEKLRRYEEQKKLQSDLVSLKKNLERADDEVRREYFTLFVKSLVHTAEEELESIEMEKPLAEMRKSAPDQMKKSKREAPPPLKPVIITKNELQKKVFGMGYPSLPTMTVDEFYSERVKEGIFPASGSNYAKTLQDMTDPEVGLSMEEEDKVKKEIAEETDDSEELQKARNLDDFKDNHRRGWGNRYNRS